MSSAQRSVLSLAFDRGTLVARNVPPPGLPPPWAYDDRIDAWRAPAMAYRDLVVKLVRDKVSFEDQARRYETLRLQHLGTRVPHPYQKAALEAWVGAGKRGVVVLPTGAGKAFVAELALARVQRSTLVVVPTIDLLNQWYDVLSSAFDTEIGLLGGGHHEVRPVTVTTYDSAYLHLDRYGDRFGLLVFDECHHLPGHTYAMAAEWAIAPFRLGLTATPERADGAHVALNTLVGPVAHTVDVKDLAGAYLADYQIVRLDVHMRPEEFEVYQRARATYRAFVQRNGIRMGSPDGFRRFLFLASRSAQGRAAYQAFRTSRKVALAPAAKLDVLQRLLVRHRSDRMILFTHENDMVYDISRRFLIPAITHRTHTKERREILQRFRDGTYRVIATSRVLNEGVDVPAANVGVILSGSASVREHVQRLGRLLRRDGAKEAILYEMVTRGSLEEHVSERRRDHRAYR